MILFLMEPLPILQGIIPMPATISVLLLQAIGATGAFGNLLTTIPPGLLQPQRQQNLPYLL